MTTHGVGVKSHQIIPGLIFRFGDFCSHIKKDIYLLSVKPLLCVVVLIFIYHDFITLNVLPFVMHFTGGENLVQIIINSTFREQ